MQEGVSLVPVLATRTWKESLWFAGLSFIFQGGEAAREDAELTTVFMVLT